MLYISLGGVWGRKWTGVCFGSTYRRTPVHCEKNCLWNRPTSCLNLSTLPLAGRWVSTSIRECWYHCTPHHPSYLPALQEDKYACWQWHGVSVSQLRFVFCYSTQVANQKSSPWESFDSSPATLCLSSSVSYFLHLMIFITTLSLAVCPIRKIIP